VGRAKDLSALLYLKTVINNFLNLYPIIAKLYGDCEPNLCTVPPPVVYSFTFWRHLQYCGPGWLVDWNYVEGMKRVWKFEISSCGSSQTHLLTYLLTYLLHGAESFLRTWLVLQLVKKFPAFLEPESSSPYSQVPATCPYPEPTPSSPHNPLPLPEDPS